MSKLINIIFIFMPIAFVWAQTPLNMKTWKLQDGQIFEASSYFEMSDNNQRVYVWLPGEDQKMGRSHWLDYKKLSKEDRAGIQAAIQRMLVESQPVAQPVTQQRNMINNGVESAAETVSIPARPNRIVTSVSGTYIPATRSDGSIEDAQSSSIGYQSVSGSNKKQRGAYNIISEGPDSQMSNGNNDETKRREDQRKRDEWYAQEEKNRQDSEVANKNRRIESQAFQLEGEIRNSRYSSSPNYQGMAAEASSLSQDSRRVGNSGAAFHFGNAESKLNQISHDTDSFNRNSSFGSQDINSKRREAESSVFFGGASVR